MNQRMRLGWLGVSMAAVVILTLSAIQPAASDPFDDARARVCTSLLALQAAYPYPQVQQSLAPYLERYGCTSSVPTTAPPPTGPATTTTTIHMDCPLPGGGIGPCPTTTTALPPTSFPTTTPTTLPGGTTLPTTSTTLPPCLPTTTGTIPPTTVPCIP